jgi:hypothetical protein
MVGALCLIDDGFAAMDGPDIVLHTHASRELHNSQVNEVVSATEGSLFSASTVSLLKVLKLMPGNKVEHLIKKCVVLGYGLILLLLSLGYK